MTILSASTSCGTAATLIFSCRSSVAEVTVHNHGGGAIHLGTASVVVESGIHVKNNETVTLKMYAGDSLYAITETGTATVDLFVSAPNP